MPFPETTRAQAEALLPKLAPVSIDGYTLSARVVDIGLQPVVREVNGKTQWVEEPGAEVVFEGGRWGPHTLRCSVSSPERILAHWDGYKAAHTQHAERVQALRTVPAGKQFQKPKGWSPRVGERCWFDRGMYGLWQGTIRRLYHGRGGTFLRSHVLLADIAFTGANGRHYISKRVPVSSLSKNGVRPNIEEK